MVSICIPSFRVPNPNLDRLLASLADHTSVPYETVVLDCEGESRGYTAPQNEAVAAADCGLIVAANDDVVIHGDWFAPLFDAMGRSLCATPDMTHYDGPQIFAPYFMMWWRDAWNELGGLDEQFIVWCSDIDLARRFADQGHMPVRVKLDPPIEHDPGATSRYAPEVQGPMNEAAWRDLCNYQTKWGVTAEVEKGRLAQWALGNIGWPP